MEKQMDEVLNAINCAFADTIYPGDDRIAEAYPGDWETEEIRAALKGQKWKDLSKATLEAIRQGVPFLSAQGFSYYLPALMSFCMTDYEAADVLSLNLFMALSPPRLEDLERLRMGVSMLPNPEILNDDLKDEADDYQSGRLQQRFEERVFGITTDQKRSIREFLEYMREVRGEDFPSFGPGEALERYWNQF